MSHKNKTQQQQQQQNLLLNKNEMYVTKRNAKLEIVSLDKILSRIKKACNEDNLQINYTSLAIKVIDQIYDKITTTKIDELTAELCASLATVNPDYNALAGRIIVSNHHKNTTESFSKTMYKLYNYQDKSGKSSPLLSDSFIQTVRKNKEFLDKLCDYSRDYNIDYFGFKTLERSYLMKIDKISVERPQHMWLRVAVGIHGANLEKVKETYDGMSNKFFTHATPTLFNAGTPRPQLSSCFLLSMEDDSIEGIFNTLKECAQISKWAGGIGLHIHNVRANGSHIRGTNGVSGGITPMLRVFNETAQYIDQGGKRNGSFAIYMEPWHADIENFLDMRKNHGDEKLRARDLFYGLWIPDLFMERVKSQGTWTLMCPDECPHLSDVYGQDFVDLYTKYEQQGKGRKTVLATDLWFEILDAQMETGIPYMVYKDAVNRKSNQKNIGVIKSSNLCVSGNTRILTDRGHIVIKTLENQHVYVWNGKQFSQVQVKKTGVDQEMVRVLTSDGSELICTPYHKFYLEGKTETVEARNLKENDVLESCEFPSVYGDRNVVDDAVVNNLDEVPDSSCSLATKLAWFRRYCSKDNMNYFDGSIITKNNSFAKEIKNMLQLCGVNVFVSANMIWISHKSMTSLLGFDVEELTDKLTDKHDFDTVKIVSVTALKEREDTYCFTEPFRHRGVFNGIMTGQCTEIVEVSNSEETAVCNLASIALPAFVEDTVKNSVEEPSFKALKRFSFEKLHKITKTVTENLNCVIDINYYPTEKTKRSNMRHRPIGIGVQGLADTFIMLGYAFASQEAKQLNKDIFETIYHAALEKSAELAEQYGVYETFRGSPASEGILQFDMWGVTPTNGRYDWTALKERIQKTGLRNSLLVAPMPTASTSQILGYNECIEPITSNIYSRRTLAGEFILANKYLVKELIDLGIWNEEVKNSIVANQGSCQHLAGIPNHVKEKYKTVWEISMRHLIDMSADRGAFICQSQSLNLWLADPNRNNLTSMHFYAWSKGLKTGIYYLRRRGKHQAQQFTIEPEKKGGSGGGECETCSA